MANENKNTLIYIAADSRSGSTLLDLLIGNHSEIVSIGELRRLHEHFDANYACTCDTLFNTCEFWKAIERRLNSSNQSIVSMQTLIPRSKTIFHDLVYLLPNFILQPLMRGIPWLSRDIEIAENNLQIIDAVSEETQKRYIVDSSKVFKFSRLYHLLRPKSCKTIFLVRDGRGVCYSRSKDGSSIKASANVWSMVQLKFFFLKLIVPRQNKLTVYYESLCRDPEKEIKRICQFIGVQFEHNCVQLVKQGRHNICGNPMRFRTDETQIRLDESWMSALTDEEKTKFHHSLAGIINWILGYR
ncbi:MAG: sulfotransferase [Gammaproteobacteria bacterium]|nr:sulfotransferase [Gammaproteobacteria bacterium]